MLKQKKNRKNYCSATSVFLIIQAPPNIFFLLKTVAIKNNYTS